MSRRLVFALCLLLMLYPIVGSAQTWNYADDYSATENPNGVWSFGWRTTSSQPLILYTDHGTDPFSHCEVDYWYHDINSSCPLVGRNPYDYPYQCGGMALPYPSHAAWIHPGPEQQSVVRWTAPAGSQIQVVARFTMLDIGSDIVRVYHNGSEVFVSMLSALGQIADYNATLTVQSGDVIECAADPISFYYSTTLLDLELTTVGAPIGACCFSSGDCLLGTEADCEGAGGRYVGDGVACDPDPCGSTPAEDTTWGQMKSRFQ
jgi:hypothetical protein